MTTELCYCRVLITERVFLYSRLTALTKIIPGLKAMPDLETVLNKENKYTHKGCTNWDANWQYKSLCILFDDEFAGPNWRKDGIAAGRIIVNIHGGHFELVTSTIPRHTCITPKGKDTISPFPNVKLTHVPLSTRVLTTSRP